MPMKFNDRISRWREPEGETVSIAIGGDICPAEDSGSPEFAAALPEVLREVKPFFDDADFRLVQWETVLSDGGAPIVKSGPNLRRPPACAAFAEALGTDLAMLANNHIGDFGPDAVMETAAHLHGRGIATVGAGKNLADARKPWRGVVNGVRITLFNRAENEFGGATADRAGSAPQMALADLAEVRAAREESDLVGVLLHGGNEYYPLPSPRLAELCRAFADAGADFVFNCHTHIAGGVELHNGVPIVYSPGNFYFPSLRASKPRSVTWFGGYLVKFHCDRRGAFALELQPIQLDESGKLRLPSPAREALFFRMLEEFGAIIDDPRHLGRCFDGWCTQSGLSYMKAMYKMPPREPAPDFTDPALADTLAPVKNIFGCEAHNELLRRTLLLITEHRLADARRVFEEEVEMFNAPAWLMPAVPEDRR